MNQNVINLSHLFYCLLIISLCFTEGIGYITLSVAVSFILIIIICLTKHRFFYSLIIKSLCLSEIRWLLLFFVIAFLGSIINVFCGHINVIRFILSFFVTYICSFLVFFVFGMFLPFIFNNKKTAKIFMFVLFLIISFGFLEFLIYSFKIYSFDQFHIFMHGCGSRLGYKMGLLPRIQSFFVEPSHYAWFLSCSIPLTFSFFKTKKRLFKNIIINKIMTKSLLPMTLLALILTQSAINCIFGTIICFICYVSFNRINFAKICKIILLISIAFIFVTITIYNIDISQTFLYRIKLSLEHLNSFDSFMSAEPSLATRIVSYTNMFIIYIHNPIIGTGCGSLASELQKQLINSPLPLTYELYKLMGTSSDMGANPSILFKLLVDTGSLGFLCIFEFFVNMRKRISFVLARDKYFLLGIKITLIIFAFLTFYDSQMTCHYYWCLFGLPSGMYLKQNLIRKVIFRTINHNK